MWITHSSRAIQIGNKEVINAHTSESQTILVTGGCGYIGSRLIRDLAMDARLGNVTIRILDNMQGGHYQALMDLPDNGRFQFIEGDILDSSAVLLALQGVDAVIHLAAIVRTPMNFEHPAWMEQVNHWGTNRLVEACLETGIDRFIYTSSAAVYGPGGPFTEKDPCQPIGPYAHSKRKAEISVLSASERGLEPTVLRLGTVFGLAPTMRFDAVANRFAYLAGVDRSLTIYGSGKQLRPFIHVNDVSSIIRFCLAQKEVTSKQIINAIGENVSILDLVKAIQLVKPKVVSHFTEQDVLTHLSFEINTEKLQSFGWQHRVTVQKGLEELLKHFKQIERAVIQQFDTNEL